MLSFIPYPEWLKPELIPGFPFLRWYGLMYLIAFGITYMLVKAQVKDQGLAIAKEDVLNLFFWGIVGLLVGARFFAVTIYDQNGFFLRNPLQAILPFSWLGGQCTFTGFQGMSYHGGLLGGTVAIVIYCKVKRFEVLALGDMILAGTPLGYFFGRLGNFINAELYGRITTAPWGMVFPQAEQVPVAEPWVKDIADKIGMDVAGLEMVNLPRHPSQLYEAFFEGIFLWLILWFIVRKHSPFRGFLVGCYIIGYGVVRFFIEYTRQPDVGIDFPIRLVDVQNPGYVFLSPWNFTTGQILCFIMILGGIASMVVFKNLARKRELQTPAAHQNLKKLRKRTK